MEEDDMPHYSFTSLRQIGSLSNTIDRQASLLRRVLALSTVLCVGAAIGGYFLGRATKPESKYHVFVDSTTTEQGTQNLRRIILSRTETAPGKEIVRSLECRLASRNCLKFSNPAVVQQIPYSAGEVFRSDWGYAVLESDLPTRAFVSNPEVIGNFPTLTLYVNQDVLAEVTKEKK